MKRIYVTLLFFSLISCRSHAEFPYDPQTGEPSDGLLGTNNEGLYKYRRVIQPHMASRAFKERCKAHGKYWIEVIQRCEPILNPED